METRFLCTSCGILWIGIQGWKWFGISKKAPHFRIWFPTREV